MKAAKIRIRRVDPEVFTQKGLFDGGCYGSRCNDDCCIYGCDVDLATLKLIERYRHLIEPLIKAKIEDCFSTKLKRDSDYIGGAYRETAVRAADGLCGFHLVGGKKGCSLFYLWAAKGITKKIVPTICRVYPLSWHRGQLFIDRPLKRLCKCLEGKQEGALKTPSVFDTQRKEVLALFELDDPLGRSFTELKSLSLGSKKRPARRRP